MGKRGRPPQPPRTDPAEIKRNQERLNADIEARIKAMFPDPPSPKKDLSRLLEALPPREELTEEEREKRLADWQALVEERQRAIQEALEPPPEMTEEERHERLAQSRAIVAANEAADAARRGRRKKPDLQKQLMMPLPVQPQWIRDEAFESITYLHDAAPELLRPSPDLRIARVLEALKHDQIPARVRRLLVKARNNLWTERCDITKPTPAGARAALIHYVNVIERMKRFAATCPQDADGRVKIPRDVALRLFVPAFNATHSDRRRCLECATVFALRDDEERRRMKYCGAGGKCASAVHSRKAKAAARKIEAEERKVDAEGVKKSDALKKVRSRDMGDDAIERYQRSVASFDLEDLMAELIDKKRDDERSQKSGGKSKNGPESDT
jgi:hypothetical protein